MLKFIRAGMYTSGTGWRPGRPAPVGISRCGALDKPAMTIANLLVGNAPRRRRWKLRWVRSMCSLPATAGSR